MGNVYCKLDYNTRADILATVRRAAIEILEGPQENWITADEVSKMFPFFNKDFADIEGKGKYFGMPVRAVCPF